MRTRRKKHKDREAAILLSSLFCESRHLHYTSLLRPAVKLSIKRSEFSSSQIHLPLQTILHITFDQSLGTSVHVAQFRNCYFQISFHIHDDFLSITLPGKRREERWYKEAWSIFFKCYVSQRNLHSASITQPRAEKKAMTGTPASKGWAQALEFRLKPSPHSDCSFRISEPVY